MPGPLTKYAREHGHESGPRLDPLNALLEMWDIEQADVANRRTPFLEWALRVPEPKSGTLDFDRYPFQRELYSEGAYAKEMVIKKATQLGISAWLTRWVMYHADIGALVALYVFPKLAQMYDFADARVKQAILGSEYLRGRVPAQHIQNKGLRQVGLGMVYFRGSETKTGLDSVDADVLALDEYDTLCLAAGSLILTRQGYAPIEEIEVGEEVLTHRGRWMPVKATSNHPATALIEVKAHGVPGIKGTPDHPFYVIERDGYSKGRRRFTAPKWVDAADLDNSMLLAQMLPPVEENNESCDWWWLVGRYLADGCCDQNSMHIDCATDEADELLERVSQLFPNACRRPYKEAAAVRVSVGSRALVEKLMPFGRLAHGKRFTGEMFTLDRERAAALLDGYRSGDGTPHHRGWATTSVSRELALGVALLVQRVHGIVATCMKCAPPVGLAPRSGGKRVAVNARPQYKVTWSKENNGPFVDGDFGWKPIKAVEPRLGERVYNLSVAEDESFVTENAIVHNTQENVPDAERRISGSDVALIRRVGVPSTPNWGIDKLYNESDQRRWMIKCEGCRTHQHLEFPENVDLEKAIIICRKCQKPLDVRKGEWVAEFPERNIPGYHMPRLIKPNTNIADIIKASKATNPSKKKTHFNKDLGLAYADEEGRLSDEAIAAAVRAYSMTLDGGYAGDQLVTMGVDVASARSLNARVSIHLEGDRKRALWIGRPDNFDEVADLIRRFNVKMCAIDSAPDERLARKIVEMFPGRVYLVNYAPNAKQVFTVNEEMKMASVRRVEAIDATYDLIRRQLNELPGGRTGEVEALPEGYKEELQGEVRETETDEFGRVVVRYKKTGANDYTHAEVYDVVATECWHYRQQIDSDERETFQPLDDMLEFQRVELEPTEDDLAHYEPGLEDMYEAGFGE